MAGSGFALFDTPIGRCGIAWSPRGIAQVQLPERDERATRVRLLARDSGLREASPPPAVRRAQAGIVALLRGERAELGAIPLDMEGVPPFHRRVYEAAREIPPCRTLTYGEVAAQLCAPGSARAVGQALGRNPFAIVVPCHRVLAANGRAGGFSARGGVTTKLRLLELERARGADEGDDVAGTRGSGKNGKSGKKHAKKHAKKDPKRNDPKMDPPALFEGAGADGFDPKAAVKHLRASDPTLARWIDAAPPFELELLRTSSLFAALAEAIVHQQLSNKAAATIYGRVRALFPRSRSGPGAEKLAAVSDAQLREAGLSRAKVLALRDLARRSLAGELPTLAQARHMDDDAIVERLTAVRGIGRWTAEMLLIFRLGRPDVLPVDDFGVRKGFAIVYRKRELPTPKALAAHGARWAPFRTAASWYLWRALEQEKT
jgi:methylated-DNA-[protein]-cysteine S-methyltransferase